MPQRELSLTGVGKKPRNRRERRGQPNIPRGCVEIQTFCQNIFIGSKNTSGKRESNKSGKVEGKRRNTGGNGKF